MLRRVSVLALALALAACGDDSDSDVATIDQMRVVKVSGDQSAQVPPPEIAGALRVTATVGEDGWTDEPLIARIVTTGGGAQATITGLSADVVPAGTLVHWYLPEECGRLFAQTTATDDSAYTVNRWAPGTKAMTCHAQAGRLVGTEIVMDTTWTLEVLPGPVAQVQLADMPSPCIGDTLDMRNYIARGWDAYGNEIPVDTVRALPDDAVSWQWEEAVQGYTGSGPVVSGWAIVVPDFGQHGYTKRTTKDGFGYYTVRIISSLSSKYVAAAHISRVYICN